MKRWFPRIGLDRSWFQYTKRARNCCVIITGISLLSVPGKVLCKVLQRRLSTKVDEYLMESQCGFRKGRGCIDHMFAIRLLVEKPKEFHSPVYFCFLDLKKAYDSVNRSVLWEILKKRYCLPNKFVSILKAFNERTVGMVRVAGKLSAEFNIENGVRHGDVLAPVLFNLFLDALFSIVESRIQGCVVVMGCNLEEFRLVGSRKKMSKEVVLVHLEYADDMVVTCDSMEDLKCFVREVDRVIREMGMIISAKNHACWVLVHLCLPTERCKRCVWIMEKLLWWQMIFSIWGVLQKIMAAWRQS